MDRPQIAAALEACARELDAGQRVDLKRSGFWRAVDAVKRDRALVEAFAPRIADIDRRAFLASTPLVFPGAVGVAILSAGLVVGLILVGAAFPLSPDPLGGVALLLGAGA